MLTFEELPPFLQRQGLGPPRGVDAYNAEPGASLRPGQPAATPERERQLLATGLEEGCDEIEEGWQGGAGQGRLRIGNDADQGGVHLRLWEKSRSGHAKVPKVAIFTCAKRLVPPQVSEGFESLRTVRVLPDGSFGE